MLLINHSFEDFDTYTEARTAIAAEHKGGYVTSEASKQWSATADTRCSDGTHLSTRQSVVPAITIVEEDVSAQASTGSSSHSSATLVPPGSIERPAAPKPPECNQQSQTENKAYRPSSNSPSMAYRSFTAWPPNPAYAPAREKPSPLKAIRRKPVPTPPLSTHASRTPVPASTSVPILDILPAEIEPITVSSKLEDIRAEAATLEADRIDTEELTASWDRSASLTRKKNASERRRRQEECEAHNDDLFNNDEISYAELMNLELEQKDKDLKLKRQEEKDELQSYVDTVFDKVYNDLQSHIGALTDLYIEVETLLPSSLAGIKALERSSDTPNTQACLDLLVELFEQIERTHEQVVQVVAQRDQRYKHMEMQPFHLTGDKAKLRVVQEHFEQAEKQAISRAKNGTAERMGDLVKTAEEAVVQAVRTQLSDFSRILTALRDLKSNEVTLDILQRSGATSNSLVESQRALLAFFNRLEVELNRLKVIADVSLAQVDNAPASKIETLESEKIARELQLKEEFERRLSVLEGDLKEMEELIESKW